MLDDTFDRAVLPGGVPPLEDNQNPVAVLDDVPLNLDELNLQVVQRGAIDLSSGGLASQVLG